MNAQKHENIEKPEVLVLLHLLGNSQFTKLNCGGTRMPTQLLLGP